jgi:hypothetical protein
MSLCSSSELSSHALLTLFVLALVSRLCLHQKPSTFDSTHHLYSCPSLSHLSHRHLYYPSAYSIVLSLLVPFYFCPLHVIVVDSKSHRLYALLSLSLQTLPYLLHFILRPLYVVGGTLGETLRCIIFALYLSLVYSRVCVVFGLSFLEPTARVELAFVLSLQPSCIPRLTSQRTTNTRLI